MHVEYALVIVHRVPDAMMRKLVTTIQIVPYMIQIFVFSLTRPLKIVTVTVSSTLIVKGYVVVQQ
jgi:hypothetical protein